MKYSLLLALMSCTLLCVQGCSAASSQVISKSSKSCETAYVAAYHVEKEAVIYEYDKIDDKFPKELSCLTGYTAQHVKGPKASIGFHVKSTDTFRIFHFDFEQDILVLQTFSNVPSLSTEGYVLEMYIYLAARGMIAYLQSSEPVPNYPVDGRRGIVPFEEARKYFDFLKTGKKTDDEEASE